MKATLFSLLLALNFICHSQTSEKRFFNEWGEPTSKDSSNHYKTWLFEKQRYNDYTYYTSNNKVKAYEPKSGNELLHGEASYFYENGQLQCKIKYYKGQPFGVIETFYPNGALQKIQAYDSILSDSKFLYPYLLSYYDSLGKPLVKNGRGHFIEYTKRKPGIWRSIGRVKDGVKDSLWLTFYPNGKLFCEEKWQIGKFIEGRSYNEFDEETKYTELETYAGPNGGMAAFYKYIGEKMKYPVSAKRTQIEGRVFVEFIVERDGTLTNIKVVKGISPDCDKEAIRLVAMAPKWKPGHQKGQPVRSKFNLAIIFKLT